MTPGARPILRESGPDEVWVEIHYRYNGELFRYNLPLEKGAKFLDGVKIEFSYRNIRHGRHFTVTMEPLGVLELESFELTGRIPFGNDVTNVFVNGYQSWTGSRERSPAERLSGINWPGRILSMDRFGDYRMHPYSEKKGNFHGYSYAYLRYPDRLLFSGSLDESSGFTRIAIDLRHDMFSVNKDVAGLRLTEERRMLSLVLIEGSENEVFERYRELRGGLGRSKPRAAAWSSWHIHGQDIDEVKIRQNLEAVRERRIPLRYFIVDDGWQSVNGDWQCAASRFPSGMSALAAEIKGSGYVPGIAFSPFIVGGDSPVFRGRKDWIARDRRRRIRPVGWIPSRGGTFYAFDLSREDVREYIASAIRRFRDDWGYGLIKLDLLYAAALYPPDGESRGVAMNKAMAFLESIKGDAEYLVGGVPLESAFGRAEYCRIGADTTPYWEHHFHRNIHCRERASTLNNLRSVVGRRQLNGLFFTSATDAFYLKERPKIMDPGRRYTQFLLHQLLGGLTCTSDPVGEYDEDELRTYLSQFPIVTPQILDETESRRTITIRYRASGRLLIAISNLAEHIRTFTLPEGQWFGAPGLKRRAHHVVGGRKQVLKPGESRNYLLLEDTDSFAGSDGHVFPGCELASLSADGDRYTAVPAQGVLTSFRIWLRSASGRAPVVNGVEAEPVKSPFGPDLYSALVTRS